MKQFLAFIALLAFVFSCNNSKEPVATTSAVDSAAMAKEAMLARNKATAMAFVQSVNAHNINDMVKDLAADYTEYGNGGGKPMKGIDSLKKGMQMFLTSFPDLKGENIFMLADGNQVAIFGDYSGTFKGDMGKMKATGKSFKIKDVDLLTFNDAGKITEHRSIQSDDAMMNQIMKKK